MYEEGDGGLQKNRAKARELYLLSANQGFDKAQMEVGMAYEVGDGVPRSRERAIQMLRASGLGIGIAGVLSSRQTPARFADLQALGAYIKRLADIENAKVAARIRASLPPSNDSDSLTAILARREQLNWSRRNEPGYCAFPPCK